MLLSIIGVYGFSQNISVPNLVNENLNYLGKPIPGDFEKEDNDLYKKTVDNIDYELNLKDSVVCLSTISEIFEKESEADQFYSSFLSYFDKNWKQDNSKDDSTYYVNDNNIVVLLNKPVEIFDGYYFVEVTFSK